MTRSIKDSLTLLSTAFADLPKARDDLTRYTDSDFERVQAFKHDFDAFYERCLGAWRVPPTLKISSPDYADILTEAVRQSHRDIN